jgi:hypothetical protein
MSIRTRRDAAVMTGRGVSVERNIRFLIGLACAAGSTGAWAQSAAATAAAAGGGLWQDVAETSVKQVATRAIVPSRYRLLALDNARLTAQLANVPLESKQDVRASAATVTLPLPDGKYAEFRIVESPIMQLGLAAKYPQIRTYLGQGITDPGATLRFDVTPKGLRAQILSAAGATYIDPYQGSDTSHYIAYAKRDYARSGERMQCTVRATHGMSHSEPMQDIGISPTPNVSSGATLRTYRLALSATGEYTAFQGGTVADALAGMVSTMNRVDGIYERELGVRMVLVDNTDLNIYTDAATDPFTNDDGGSLLDENQWAVDKYIGSANYDIGHIFSTGGGGIAALGSVCQEGGKANGVTGSSRPTGDAYDVDYVAHEMGHQFGGPHTFNSQVSSCGGGNREATDAYEPGSGITIMAYAGICGSENLQPHSEDYFHRSSLNRIFSYIAGDGACGVSTSTGNTPPTVTTAPVFTIPARTPFVLTAMGSDADGDALTYIWEEMDLGAATGGGALSDDGSRPLFRAFDPSPDPSRTFPSLRYILNNANVVPATAPLPGTTTPNVYTGELLPTTSRTLNFRVTARDNRPGGGGTNEAATAITVNSAAGPFAVTAPNTAVSWAAGSSQTVAWDVANTNAAPVNTASVAIKLSLDGGYTWAKTLAANAPNTGSATVTIPADTPATTQARIRVEAIGNIYFDISDANFTITGTNTAPTINVTGPLALRQGSPAATASVATVTDTQDGAGSLTLALSDVPSELTASVATNAGTVALTAAASCGLVAPTTGSKVYPLRLTATDSAGSPATAFVNVQVSANQPPTLGTYASRIMTRGTTATFAPTAAPADPNGNYVGVSVSPTTLPGGGTLSIAPDGTVTVATDAGTTYGYYKIRANAVDTCGATETREFTVQVTTPEPLLNFGDAQVSTGNQVIEPNECNAATVTLKNEGASGATAISSSLSTTTPGVTIAQAASAYADIGAAASGANTTAFQISTAPTLACYGTIDFTQTVTYAGGGSPRLINFSLPVGRRQASTYTFDQGTGGTITTTGTLLAGSRADDAVASLTVPADFNFSIMNTPIAGGSTLRVSTNGNIQFVSSGGTEAWGNTPLPAFGSGGGQGVFPVDAPTLFAYWEDLDLRGSGGVFTEVTGTAPNRVLKVEWRGKIANGGPAVDFAVLFRENSNLFDIVYKNAASADGSSATIGWQAGDHGTDFTAFSINRSTVTSGMTLTSSIALAQCTVGTGMCTATDLIFRDGFDP